MSSTWENLLAQRRVAREAAGREEIESLRALAERNMTDAAIEAADPDTFGRCADYSDSCRSLRNTLSY